jgi:hypothetical protein
MTKEGMWSENNFTNAPEALGVKGTCSFKKIFHIRGTYEEIVIGTATTAINDLENLANLQAQLVSVEADYRSMSGTKQDADRIKQLKAAIERAGESIQGSLQQYDDITTSWPGKK